TAMEAATLHRMFPGRVTLGVGHGVQDWMGQVGARPESPLTLLREHLLALRALLRGERVTTSGRYVRLDDVALDWPPAPEDAVVLAGGTGPRTVRLTGEAADGTILTVNTSAEGVRRARRLVDEGRAEAGRRAEPHRLVVYLLAATGPGAAERVRAELDAEGAAPDADAVILQPTADEPDPEGFVRFVAQEVAPELQGTGTGGRVGGDRS